MKGNKVVVLFSTFLNGHPSSCQPRPTGLNFGVLYWESRTNPPRDNTIALQASVAYVDITLPPHHYVRVRQPPAWSLTTEGVSQQIIHVLRFPVIRSIIILVHANIYSLSLAVRLKRNVWLTASKCRLEAQNCQKSFARSLKRFFIRYAGLFLFRSAKQQRLTTSGVHQHKDKFFILPSWDLPPWIEKVC